MKNKTGIYFAFWERDWNADYCAYIEKAKKLGFDTLEIGAGALSDMSFEELKRISDTAKDNDMDISYCIGLPGKYNVASLDEKVRMDGIEYMKNLLGRISYMGGDMLGGIIYAAWPGIIESADEKQRAREKSLDSMKVLAQTADSMGVTLCLEVVNRFEQFIMNTVEEAIEYVNDFAESSNYANSVRLLLDSFHMNIEEDDMYTSIRKAGDLGLIGHFHIGECNRKVPGFGSGRMPWDDIVRALADCNYQGRIVMEPFIKTGGEVGRDIKIYHDLSNQCTDIEMDSMALQGCSFIKNLLAKY